MKVYFRILGITLTILLISAIVAVVVEMIDSSDAFEIFLVAVIPIYILAHYLIMTKFGFITVSNESNKFGISTLVLTVIAFIVIIGLPLNYLNNLRKELKYYSESIELGEETTAHSIKTNLKIKYIDGSMSYVFTSTFDQKENERPNVVSYTIELLDGDGFQIDDFYVSEWTTIIDNDSQPIGTSTRSSTYLSVEKFRRIASYKTGVTTSD